MASAKYIGYVGGMAVAAGVGAAIAVAGQGTAHADDGATAAKSETAKTAADSAGPKKKPAANKPFTKLNKAVNDAVQHAAKDAADHVTKQLKASDAAAAKLKKSAAAFEAEQVDKLRNAFKPVTKPVSKPVTDPVTKPASKPKGAVAAAAPSASSTGVLPPGVEPAEPSINPFRPEDPTPFSMPATVRQFEKALLSSPLVPDALDPFVREGVEAAYRGSQMVPYVNVVVPISQILPQLTAALSGDEGARDATQVIVNELLVTTQPVSFLYYGYDEIADLLNVEFEAQEAKEEFYATAWNILDPFHVLHNAGKSGLERYPGLATA
jgi:hypothetical protein